MANALRWYGRDLNSWPYASVSIKFHVDRNRLEEAATKIVAGRARERHKVGESLEDAVHREIPKLSWTPVERFIRNELQAFGPGGPTGYVPDEYDSYASQFVGGRLAELYPGAYGASDQDRRVPMATGEEVFETW